MAERKSTGTRKSLLTEAKDRSLRSRRPEPKRAKPNLNVEERMEGVQGWMAELEKRQERSTRVGGIAVGLAVLAAAGALVLGILNKQDAATTEDVDELTEKVNALGASVEQQTERQLKGINQRLATVEQQIASINERQRKAEADIADAQEQTRADVAAGAAAAADVRRADAGEPEKQPVTRRRTARLCRNAHAISCLRRLPCVGRPTVALASSP